MRQSFEAGESCKVHSFLTGSFFINKHAPNHPRALDQEPLDPHASNCALVRHHQLPSSSTISSEPVQESVRFHLEVSRFSFPTSAHTPVHGHRSFYPDAACRPDRPYRWKSTRLPLCAMATASIMSTPVVPNLELEISDERASSLARSFRGRHSGIPRRSTSWIVLGVRSGS